jgi:transcriptional regulator with XRE-family HTH domain
MQRNLLHYQRALFLRKKKGYSYNEIMAEIPVAKSTLSSWLNQIQLTTDQQKRISQLWIEKIRRHNKKHNLGEWNRKKRQEEITAIRVRAKKRIGALTRREFQIAGIMLYWAEGSKSGDGIQICNADPLLMIFMMHWFRTFFPLTEDRFYGSIHYHEGQNEQEIKEFWSKLTKVPLQQFNKSFKKPPGTGHRKHYLQWGVFRIRVTRSADLFHELAGWKDGLIQNIIFGSNNVRP